jgi:RNA polymerase sigma factor (sigma-70 family)
MATPSIDWNVAFAEQRSRLVRLYTHLTGRADVADDLAQEALMEAWRSLHKLHDDDGLPKWLNAIARNVFLRWKRQVARDACYSATPIDDEVNADLPESLILNDDPTLGLEREDLARLLGRALALLPEQTRYLLIASYLWETPQAELATQIDVHESALRVRLHRSRAKLRDVLRPALAGEPDAPLFTMPLGDEFPRWCPFCGKRRLVCQRIGNTISFRCSGPCIIWPPGTLGNSEKIMLDDPSVALDEHLEECHAFYRQGLHAGNVRCPTCGRVNAVTTTPPEGLRDSVISDHRRLFIHRCRHCPNAHWNIKGDQRCSPALSV